VHELKRRDAARYDALIERQAQASVGAVRALRDQDAYGFVDALRAQLDALDALGSAAAAGIVTPAVRQAAALSEREGAVVLPSGAGGGDIVLFAGLHPPSSELRQQARQLSLSPLPLRWGAAGVQNTNFAPWHKVHASPDSTS
jgi:phosphomevalonate kinase